MRVATNRQLTMHYQYKTSGTCSRLIDFDIEDGKVYNVTFTGGCHGNLQGIGRLVDGLEAAAVADILGGVDCHGKGTSCPDQLACALSRALEQEKNSANHE